MQRGVGLPLPGRPFVSVSMDTDYEPLGGSSYPQFTGHDSKTPRAGMTSVLFYSQMVMTHCPFQFTLIPLLAGLPIPTIPAHLELSLFLACLLTCLPASRITCFQPNFHSLARAIPRIQTKPHNTLLKSPQSL